MTKLAFCNYHNMVAILEKTELNIDFHQIVDFLEASHIRYALMVRPTVYVSHIQQFWSTVRVKTVDGETKIIAKCLSPKSTGFNEFTSNIAIAIVYLATNRVYNFSKIIFDGMGEGLENPTEPHHTPSVQNESPHQEELTTSQEPLKQETTIPSQSHSDISTPRRLTRGATRISQSKVPTPGADETASLTRDDIHREAFPTATRLDAGQDRENIAKTSAMPHEASPGVTSLGGGEGSMQQQLQELMGMCTSLQQQHLLMEQQIQSQDQEITQLKNIVKTLKGNEKRR
ncbi:hypothetical protein Tco_0200132 [Tanacetum coccineum]